MSIEAEAMGRILLDAEFKALIPPLSGEERAGLEADILREGCTDALKVWRTDEGDVLLDGYNRFDICEKHGIPYRVEAVAGIADREAAMRWMISHQFHRRNLNEAQRAMLAGLLAKLEPGGDRKSEAFKSPIGDLKLADAAEHFNVGKRSVERARKVQQNGIPELARMVTEGKVSVSAAANVATLPEEEQRKVVAAGADAVAEAAREIRCRDKSEDQETPLQDSQPYISEKAEAAGSAIPQSTVPAAPKITANAPDSLLSCAHCGGEPKFAQDFDLRYGPSYCLVCGNFECRMQTPLCRSQEEARTIWNRRRGVNPV